MRTSPIFFATTHAVTIQTIRITRTLICDNTHDLNDTRGHRRFEGLPHRHWKPEKCLSGFDILSGFTDDEGVPQNVWSKNWTLTTVPILSLIKTVSSCVVQIVCVITNQGSSNPNCLNFLKDTYKVSQGVPPTCCYYYHKVINFRMVPIFVLLTWNWFVRTNFRTFERLKTKLTLKFDGLKTKINFHPVLTL